MKPHETVPAGSSRGQSGFSLIELIIVLVLLGATTLVAIPLFSGGRDFALWRSARQLEGALRFAQEWAIDHHVRTSVRFTAAADRYELLHSGSTPIPDPMTREAYSVDLGPKGIAIVSVSLSGGSSVTYESTGEATSWGTVDLTTGENTLRIEIEEDTGAIRVQ